MAGQHRATCRALGLSVVVQVVSASDTPPAASCSAGGGRRPWRSGWPAGDLQPGFRHSPGRLSLSEPGRLAAPCDGRAAPFGAGVVPPVANCMTRLTASSSRQPPSPLRTQCQQSNGSSRLPTPCSPPCSPQYPSTRLNSAQPAPRIRNHLPRNCDGNSAQPAPRIHNHLPRNCDRLKRGCAVLAGRSGFRGAGR